MATGTARDGPKVEKAILELPDRVKTSYTYEKVRLGRFGRAKVQKVAEGALLRFGPPRTPDFLVHVCKNAKVTFCNFFIFRKFKNSFTFGQMIPRRLFTDVWELLFRSKRTFRTLSGKVHFPAAKRPKCSSPYVFRGQINDFGTPKCTFR